MALEVAKAEMILSLGKNHQGEDRVAHGQGTRDSGVHQWKGST